MTTSASNASAGETAAIATGDAKAAEGSRREGARASSSSASSASSLAATRTTLGSRLVVFALCAALVLTTLAYGAVHSVSLGAFALGAGFVALCWALDAWRARALRFSRSALQLPLLGFFALGLVQLLPLASGGGDGGSAARALSLDPYATRLVLVQAGALAVFFCAALAFIDTPSRLRLVARTVVIFGFLLACFGLVQAVVSPTKIYGVRELRQAVGFGPFINRHHFAGYMEMTALLPLGMLFAGAVARERRLLYAFAALLMGIALVATNSRGGMLSLFAGVMFLAVASVVGGASDGERGRLRSAALRALAGGALVLVLAAASLLFGGAESFTRLLNTVNSDDPSTGRLHFWRGTLGVVSEHPLLGAGLGAFPSAYPRHDAGNGSLYRLEQAHNDYLQLLSDGGVVGFALGLVFVVLLFRAGLRRLRSEDTFRRGVALGSLAGCFAVLVHSLFDFTLHTTANGLLFLTLAALAVVNGRVEQPSRRRRRRRPSSASPPDASGGAAAEGGGERVAA